MKNIEKYLFLKKLESLPFIEEIWLFGSRARGDAQERSDIDLAILCPHATSIDWNKVMDIIENADTLLKIDCLQFHLLGQDDKLRENILRFKKVLYKKDQV